MTPEEVAAFLAAPVIDAAWHERMIEAAFHTYRHWIASPGGWSRADALATLHWDLQWATDLAEQQERGLL